MEFTVPVDTDPAVTSAEFIRNFSQWRLKAVSVPVIISNHGKNTHALISYDRLSSHSVSPVRDKDDLAHSALTLLADLRDGVVIVDERTVIVSMNRTACEFMRVKAEAVIGRTLVDAFPQFDNSYVYRNMMRALRSGERYSGDAPSLLREGAWLRADIFPLDAGVGFVFRDISEEIAAFHLADAKQAIIRAMELDGSIGYARLSLREAIERADKVLIDMLGVSDEAITRVKFSALMPQARRPAFTSALEAALNGEGGQKLASDLVGRDGVTIPVTLSIVELHGAFAAEGAIVVITRR